MKKDEFLLRFKAIQADDLLLMERKNADYANEEDSLSNLREFGFYGVMVRLSDKWARLNNFAKSHDLKVKEESIEDTMADTRIYLALAQILLEDENEKT